MLDAVGKDAKHRVAYGIVYDRWGDSHADLLRTIGSDAGLMLAGPSSVSHMKRNMVKWHKKQRPQAPDKKDTAIVDDALAYLRTIYVGKGAVESHEWKQLTGSPAAPGEVRSEIILSLAAHNDRKKARAAGQRWIDKWRSQRKRDGQHHDEDGLLVESQDQ
jgi:hypothetical protein